MTPIEQRSFHLRKLRIEPVSLALVVACAALGCGPKTTKDAKAPVGSSVGERGGAEPGDDKDTVAFGDNCRIKTRKDGKLSLVACEQKQAMMILPGTGWSRQPDKAPGLILHATHGLFNVSARVAESGETQYTLPEHLDAIYQGVSQQLGGAGFSVGKPALEQMKNQHLVLFYELSGTLEGESLRSAHAFTAIRRQDRRYVDYHVSLTAPPDAAIWRETPSPLEVVKDLADLFFVADENGNLPPQ